MKFKVLWIAGLMVAATAGHVQAAFVVDQSQTIDVGGFSYIDEGNPLTAQSFKQSYNNIAGARIKTNADYGGFGDVTISLRDQLLGGNLLASGTDFGVTAGDWAEVIFSSTVSVVPETTLYLFVSAVNSGLVASYGYDDVGLYSRGSVFYGTLDYAPRFDLTFQTLASDNFQAVPEPASVAMWGLGAIGLVFARRKRQQMMLAA